MKYIDRNSHSVLFSGPKTVEYIVQFILAAEEYGWKLDTWEHTDGISITEEGIRIDLCSTQELETFDSPRKPFPLKEIEGLADVNAGFASYQKSKIKDRSDVKEKFEC